MNKSDHIPAATSRAENDTARPEKEMAEAMALLKRVGPPVLTGIAVAVVVGLIILAIHQRREGAREAAAQAFIEAQTAEEFQQILVEHPRAPEAPLALLALASTRYREEEYDQARELYRQFLADYPAHPMRPMARLGLAHCDEAAGDLEAAVTGFGAFMESEPAHFLAPLAQLGLARSLFAKGQEEAAAALYGEIIDDPDHPWRPQAEEEWRHLQRLQRAQASNRD